MKKEDTPIRIAKREYERRNKENRKKASKNWGTHLPRELAEEIDAFLHKNKITKVDLIALGYVYLKNKLDNTKNSKQ